MKQLLTLEEAAQLTAAIVALYFMPFHFGWYVWVGLFLLPDVSMIGYFGGPRVGALVYNIVHHKALGVLLFLAGLFMNYEAVQLVGLLLFAHSAFDRMLGYGLKLPDSFQHTHLGMVGKQNGKKTFVKSEVAA
jgi:hypothetical protein